MSRNYTSPYAKPVQQYPSQSEDYLSLEIGGPGKCSTPSRPHYNSLNAKGAGNFYQNRQRGRGAQQNRFSVGWTNNRHSTGGYGGQWRSGGNHKQWNNRQSFGNKSNDITAFVHPSMLEDPWKDLIERRDAIKRSEINLPASASNEKISTDNAEENESVDGAPEVNDGKGSESP